MTNEVLVKVESVSKKYCRRLKRSLRYGVQDMAAELNLWRKNHQAALRPDEFWALRDVSFELRRGEALGVLGPNGAGKSTLLKLLNGLIKPDAGRITMRGRVGALIELGAGFNPILTGRENIYINAAVLGLSKKEIDRIIDDIIDFADIGTFIDTPVRSYSSGMWMRLGFAVATHLDPDVLLVDEVLAVGDLAFRRKCLRHMLKYLQNGGSLVFISHDPWMMQCICTSGLLIDRGQIAFAGTAVEAIDRHFRTLLFGGKPAQNDDSQKAVDRYFESLRGAADSPPENKDSQRAVDLNSQALQMVDGAPSENKDSQKDGLSPSPVSSQQDAGDASSEGPDDWGDLNDDNPIAIDKVEISPLRGDEIRMGQRVRITVCYRSIKVIDPVFWGFLIYTRDQLVCITADATGFSLSNGTCRVVKGKGQFRCTIPQLPLVAGTYALRVAIGDPRTGGVYANLGWENAPAFFTVRSETNEINNLYAIAGNLVQIDVRWEE